MPKPTPSCRTAHDVEKFLADWPCVSGFNIIHKVDFFTRRSRVPRADPGAYIGHHDPMCSLASRLALTYSLFKSFRLHSLLILLPKIHVV